MVTLGYDHENIYVNTASISKEELGIISYPQLNG